MTDLRAADLLPKLASTPYEFANLGAMLAAWPINVREVLRQSDPMVCDAVLLPWLAFDRGLRLWRDDWLEIKKRRYIRDAWIYLRLQGTPLGIEAYLNLAGGRVIEEHLPPSLSFLIPDDGLTHQQVLDLMPQLRLYHQHPAAYPNRGTAFVGSYLDGCALVPDAGTIFGRYPVIYDPATEIETPVQATPLATLDQTSTKVSFSEPTYGGGATYAGVSFIGNCFLGDPVGPAPLVLDLADPTMVTVRDTRPLPAKTAAVSRSYLGDCYLDPDLGDAGTYDRLYIFDPTRIPPVLNRARAATFIGVSYLGVAPYHQLLKIAVPGTPALVRPGAAFVGTSYLDGSAYLFDAADRTNHDFALEAIATAKRAGDRILVDLAPTFAGTRDATLPSMSDL